MKLSVVTSLYNSEATIEEFVRRASAAAGSVTSDYEIVMVDDGSPDASLKIAIQLAKLNPNLTVLELSRNFGHHKALMTGLMHCKGDYCFLLDSDLEEAPEILTEFWTKLHDREMDVIYGYQEQRSGSLSKQFSGMVAYKIFDWLLTTRIPRNHLTVRLMRRSYVDALLLHRETQLVIGGIWALTGFRQLGVAVNKKDKGASAYSLRRRWQLMLDSVANFSEAPLVMIFYVGLLISCASALFSFYILLRWAFGGVGVAGWVSVMLSVWFLGGLAIFFVGVIGIYISKVFLETKQRPLTIVRAIHGGRSL